MLLRFHCQVRLQRALNALCCYLALLLHCQDDSSYRASPMVLSACYSLWEGDTCALPSIIGRSFNKRALSSIFLCFSLHAHDSSSISYILCPQANWLCPITDKGLMDDVSTLSQLVIYSHLLCIHNGCVMTWSSTLGDNVSLRI